jgi:hypothetical protein
VPQNQRGDSNTCLVGNNHHIPIQFGLRNMVRVSNHPFLAIPFPETEIKNLV